jgi:hypothetical protein
MTSSNRNPVAATTGLPKTFRLAAERSEDTRSNLKNQAFKLVAAFIFALLGGLPR